MTDIEQAGRGANCLVFLHNARVLDRHVPAGEIDHARAVSDMPVVERRAIRHGLALLQVLSSYKASSTASKFSGGAQTRGGALDSMIPGDRLARGHSRAQLSTKYRKSVCSRWWRCATGKSSSSSSLSMIALRAS